MMRILFVGDFSNNSATLAEGMRRRGHECTVMSEGCLFLDTKRDIDLSRSSGKLGGLRLLIDLLTRWQPKMRGFDIVALNTPLPICLRPALNRYFIKRLKLNNRRLVLMCTGLDPVVMEELLDSASSIRYNEWRNADGSPTRPALEQPSFSGWQSPQMKAHAEAVYAMVDGATSCLYEYDLALRRRLCAERRSYIGIPIDTATIPRLDMHSVLDGKINLFLGRHRLRALEKGAEMLEVAARKMVARYPDKVELTLVENLPYQEFNRRLDNAHIVLDQVYSYTPATTALLSMARGQTVISGAEPDYFRFIGEDVEPPLLNALPNVDYLERIIEKEILQPSRILQRSGAARLFVEKHNDIDVVAARFERFAEQILNMPARHA